MNNKGFTLIELIATIALLAIISIISFVSINAVIENNKVSDCENLIKTIKSAANEYISDNRYNLNAIVGSDPSNDKTYWIPWEELISKDYISSVPVDPFDGSEMDGNSNYVFVQLKEDYTVKAMFVNHIKNYKDVDCSSGKW